MKMADDKTLRRRARLYWWWHNGLNVVLFVGFIVWLALVRWS
jgi:hypothetical protein